MTVISGLTENRSYELCKLLTHYVEHFDIVINHDTRDVYIEDIVPMKITAYMGGDIYIHLGAEIVSIERKEYWKMEVY